MTGDNLRETQITRTTLEPIAFPTMRIVYTGWTYRTRHVSADALVRYDAMRAAGVLKGRPWWRGMSRRWRKL